jgi:N-acetylglucosamine malate deacetylase 1
MTTVLVVAAHPDDEVLGCGGTMARHVADGDTVFSLFVADGETARIMAGKTNRNIAAFEASKVLGTEPPRFLDLRDQKLDTYPQLEITQAIEGHIADIKPSVVYTHHAGDLNLDHWIVHRATMTACRPLPGSIIKEIYAFEVPSSTEWGSGFAPNHFVNIAPYLMKKESALGCYKDEMRPPPHPRNPHIVIDVLAAQRGSIVGLHYAEAFTVLRSIR